MSNLPFSHLRILDLSRVRAGPTCVKFFGDFGADVIKVERTDGGGDPMGDNRHSSDYVNAQRNKRGITVNLKSPEGIAVIKKLAETADVVVENFRPDVKFRLGIDYESLAAINPRIIYTSISAFGETGPYRKRPGFDLIAQGMGGLMWLTGEAGQGPMRIGMSPADMSAGVFAALGTVIALIEREQSGKGQWVQTNLLSSQIMMLDYQAMSWLMDKRVPQQRGNDHPQIVPTGVYKSSDGYFTLSTVGNESYHRLCHAIGAPELTNDERFLTATLREQNRDAMNALIEHYENVGGLDATEAQRFVTAAVETFRWQNDALVDAETYSKLQNVHRLVADIVCFKGPHINHLTPRTLDIDAAQSEMERRGIGAKSVIEGPPRRRVPILLRQTSFKALEESISFQGTDGREVGSHTARFGEIEQRGAALTPRGRALYDELLEKARTGPTETGETHDRKMAAAFAGFPDDEVSLREMDLAYFRYKLVDGARASAGTFDLPALIAAGAVEAHPITYEDFLPVSAAGIFQSNLGGEEQPAYSAAAAQASFEAALGATVSDPFELYASMQDQSLAELRNELASYTVNSPEV
ncbi:MAG: DUF1338 family protein [Sphingobium sp.]|nr:DUF1338 family protein [Sphingobium sp.]